MNSIRVHKDACRNYVWDFTASKHHHETASDKLFDQFLRKIAYSPRLGTYILVKNSRSNRRILAAAYKRLVTQNAKDPVQENTVLY